MSGGLSPDAAYAVRNIRVEKGKLVIGDELRADLRNEGHSDANIDLAFPRALERGGGLSDPTKILPRIRWALSFIRHDKAKQAQWASTKPKPKSFGQSRYASS
jgi:hypothetical protein